MSSASKTRSHSDSGASGNKQQRLSGNNSESGETVITKEDRAADRKRQRQNVDRLRVLRPFIKSLRVNKLTGKHTLRYNIFNLESI